MAVTLPNCLRHNTPNTRTVKQSLQRTSVVATEINNIPIRKRKPPYPPPLNPTLTAACPSTTPSTTTTADEYPSPEYTLNPVVPPSTPGRQHTSYPSACATNNPGTRNVSNAICVIVSLALAGDGVKRHRSTTRRD